VGLGHLEFLFEVVFGLLLHSRSIVSLLLFLFPRLIFFLPFLFPAQIMGYIPSLLVHFSDDTASQYNQVTTFTMMMPIFPLLQALPLSSQIVIISHLSATIFSVSVCDSPSHHQRLPMMFQPIYLPDTADQKPQSR
jgi:hypothetical protein